MQRLRHRAPQRAERQAFGQGIDRIDAREFCKTGFVDDAVGMDDLQDAVVHLQGAGDVALGADRQQFLDIAGLGAEIGQHHVAGVVAGIDQMRRARVARRRRPMAVDRHFQRHHGSRHRVADFRPRPAIDHARRQMQQQIDQPRRLVAAEQIAKQFVLLRPDAGKAGDRRKQRIEQSRAHQHVSSCADLIRASILQEMMDCRVKPGNDDAVDNSGTRADNRRSRRYINPARHVRAFGVRMDRTMTGSTRSSGGLDDRRKRLLFRCWHRGTREMDLILGRFADAEIASLSDDELAPVRTSDRRARSRSLCRADRRPAAGAGICQRALFDRIKSFRAADHDA